MQTILLLHGAIGAKDQLAPLEQELSASFNVHRLNFSGHGGTPFNEGIFSIELFAKDVLSFLDREQINSIDIFGYSMGGYVALYLAKHHPQRIKRVITLATKFKWDEVIAAKETTMLNASTIEEKLPSFAHSLQQRHHPNDWKTVLQKTAGMLIDMGKENPLQTGDYASLVHPVLLMLGDRDKMVSLEETVEVYKNLPQAQLAILPGTPHPIEAVNTSRLAFEIQAFLSPKPG